MCKVASQVAGLRVDQNTFQQLDSRSEFDGIWACASLLHVPLAELPQALSRLENALKPEGVLYCSFKYGTGEHFRNGRLFVDLTEETLLELIRGTGFKLKTSWVSEDVRPGRDSERWLNALLVL
jgi:hypothetical protein